MDHSHTALIVVDNQVGALDNPFWGPERSNPDYLSNVSKVLSAFRSISPGPKAPHILHIIHTSTNPLSPLHPSSPLVSIHPSTTPLEHEPLFTKSTNSAFCISSPSPSTSRPSSNLPNTTELETYLKSHQIWKIFFVGLSIDLCLGSIIRHAADLGVTDHLANEEQGEKEESGEAKVVKGDIILVQDATAAWKKYHGNYSADDVHAVHVQSLKGEFCKVIGVANVFEEMDLSES